jgi:hypothetical protein
MENYELLLELMRFEHSVRNKKLFSMEFILHVSSIIKQLSLANLIRVKI